MRGGELVEGDFIERSIIVTTDIIEFLPKHFQAQLPRAPYFWNIDAIIIKDTVRVRGWALPFGGHAHNIAMKINGRPVQSFDVTTDHGVGKQYPWWPNASFSRFDAQHPCADLGPDWLDRNELRIEVMPNLGPAESSSTYPDARVMYFMQGRFSAPEENLMRTIGGGDAQRYEIGGRTLFHRFQNALVQETGKSFSNIGKILDWGCGPGRIACHVIPELRTSESFTGVDIVDASVDFSNAAIAPRFKTCLTEPPLPIEASSVDAAYAYSVLTHIPGPMLRDWMTEVARVLRPGGVALLTTLGELAFAHFRTYSGEDHYRHWLAQGVSDEVANDQLDGTNVPKGYYRNTWLSEALVRSLCEGLFDVKRVVKNFYFYQDLFVLRRI